MPISIENIMKGDQMEEKRFIVSKGCLPEHNAKWPVGKKVVGDGRKRSSEHRSKKGDLLSLTAI